MGKIKLFLYFPKSLFALPWMNEAMKANRLQKCHRMISVVDVLAYRKWFSLTKRFLLPTRSRIAGNRSRNTSKRPLFQWWSWAGPAPLERRYWKRVFRDVLHPWATKHFDTATLTFQQDWAPAHSANSTIAVCGVLFSGFWG